MYAIISLHRNYALAVLCKNVVHCVYVRREVYHVFRMTSEMFPGKCIGRAMFKRKSLNHHKIAGKIQNGVKLQLFLKKNFSFNIISSIYGHIIYFLCEKLKTVKHHELKKRGKKCNFILQLA